MRKYETDTNGTADKNSKIAEADGEYQRMLAEYEPAKERFTKLVDRLPKRLRNLLWSYPGMGYLMHGKMLTLICEHMKFADEE